MSQTILILDDEPDNVLLIEETIKRNLPEVRTVGFTSPQAAASWCDANEPDLCLIDYKMPGMSGIEFMARVRRRAPFQGVPMIMITGQPGTELQQQALDSGATDFLSKPINVADVVVRTRNHLRLRESLRDGRQDMGQLEREIKESAQQLVEQEQAVIIQRLTHLSGYRDEETGDHMRRMAHISQLIAQELGLDTRFCDMLLLAAPMHDIGKVAIADAILNKPAKFTEEELLRAGQRTVVLERCFNLREDKNRQDVLPWRIMHEPINEGPLKGSVNSPDELKAMLTRYYELQGYDSKTGHPTVEVLSSLGLLENVKKIDAVLGQPKK